MMIKETNKFFDGTTVIHFYEKDLVSKKYKSEFSEINKFYVIGDVTDPINTIPKNLQVFNDPIICIYIFDLTETLDWHIDEMRMDFLSSGKYTALIEGSGTLESNTDGVITSLDMGFHNRLQWVSFSNTKPHRFIVKEKAKMVMALTAVQEIADNFNVSLFWSTEVDASYPDMLNGK